MKKFTLLALVALTVHFSAHAQLTKKSWLVGGSIEGTSSSTTYGSGSLSNGTYTIAPKAGYFIVNGLAAGLELNASFGYLHQNYPGSDFNQHSHAYGFGPFVRYYFLPTAKPVNILLEVYDQYMINGYTTSPTTHSNMYGFAAGPTFFLNPHVALECTFGYSWSKGTGQYSGGPTTHLFKTAIGFQVYLPGK